MSHLHSNVCLVQSHLPRFLIEVRFVVSFNVLVLWHRLVLGIQSPGPVTWQDVFRYAGPESARSARRSQESPGRSTRNAGWRRWLRYTAPVIACLSNRARSLFLRLNPALVCG